MNSLHTVSIKNRISPVLLRPISIAVGIVISAALTLHPAALAQTPQPLTLERTTWLDQGSTQPTDWQQEANRLQKQIDELRSLGIISQASLAHPTENSESPKMMNCTPFPVEKANFPTARLTGFFQADALWASQSLANQVAVGNGVAADGDVQDGADFRRARLAATGQAWDNTDYMLEMDFAFPGRPSFMDAWMEIGDVFGGSKVRVGQFRQPFGMDGLTSVKEMTFLERGLPFAFLPFRQIGTMIHGNSRDELTTWAVSGFRFPTDTFGGNVGDNGGYGMATRVTGLLLDGGDGSGLLHVGGGYSYIDPANDLVQYRNQPEIFVGETGGGALVPTGVPSNLPPFVDTGLIATANVNMANLELAISHGSLYAQSEAIVAIVDQQNGTSVRLPGAYAYTGYFLTGEARPYNRKNGVFGRVKPNQSVGKDGGLGAWEIAGRWSYIDLNDANIRGGRLNNLTAGLNWYLNPSTKFQFNYIHSMLDSPINDESSANLFAMRTQVDF